MRTLQLHNYAKAAELLRNLVNVFRDERELSERARLYLALCERQLQPLTAEPENTEERLYAATLALNAGEVARAIRYLNRVTDGEPTNDRALYMLAVAYSAQGQHGLAIPYLQQAIEVNPENRALARVDPDLASMRAERSVSELLDAAVARSRPQPTGTRHHDSGRSEPTDRAIGSRRRPPRNLASE